MSQELSVFSRWFLLKVSQEAAINIVAGVGTRFKWSWRICSPAPWQDGLDCWQAGSLSYHIDLFTRLFHCPHNMAVVQERDHEGKGNVFYNRASGVTQSCYMPLDTQDSHNSV